MKTAGESPQPRSADASPGAASATVSRPLRFRLFLLAASGLVPLALVLLFASTYLARERQVETQRAALELSRALATAVDAELRSTVALLDNLAITTELQDLSPSQLPADEFALTAKRVAQSHGWRQVVIANAKGEVLMRIGEAANGARVAVERDSLAQVLATGAPAVGSIAKGPLGRDAFAVRVPVLKDGAVRYVLAAVLTTGQILNAVGRQQLAPSWVVAVYDQHGNRVARSIATNSPRYSPSLESLIKQNGQQGMGRTVTLEGVESHTGFTRVKSSQWVVAVGIPTSEASSDLYRLLAAVGGGTAASLALLAWLAWRMARSISDPIDVLKQAAGALGAGKQVELPALGVRELDELGAALRRAAIDRDEANVRRGKVEAERESLVARIEEALRLAEIANRNKDEFLALLGHELRNPLAPIMNAVHLMNLKGDHATAAERGIIQRQLNYVTRLVDDLLDASRIASKRFVIDPRPLQAVKVLEQTVDSLRPMLGGRKFGLHIEPAARALWVRADEARLVQIFNNLLGNAIKFTAPTGAIEVHARAAGAAIEFVFRDDGLGMSAAELERAFDLFYQAQEQAREVNGGLGLGLSIVKSLVEMHSGSVRAQSEGLGKGAIVTLSLPSAEPPEASPPDARAPAASGRSKVLVVDDNRDATDTLALLLSMSGFETQAAYTPTTALDLVDAFGPDIAVLDIGLPEMDGYELARRLRQRDPPFRGKLIALTGYGQQKDVDQALAAGFDAHLTKPVEPESLLELIARLLAAPAN
jgi:signal transduction histidine kinase/CheY-like chemotaxis protein/type II secretory pathway component PulM